jgi:nucleoside-diphosphate-sugar epimerase
VVSHPHALLLYIKEHFMAQKQKDIAFIFLAGNDFLAPYVEREFTDYDVIFQLEDGMKADVAVMISSTEVYDVVEGMNYDENTPVIENGVYAQQERIFRDICEKQGLKPTILRCANIVGTGMVGLPMRFARGIARGTLMNIKENEAVINTVHAIDVARIAHQLVASGETYNVTNGIDTRVVDLIDAIAYRVKNKQVFTLAQKWARMLYGGEYYRTMTTSLTFNNIKMVHALSADAQLIDVVSYLKNHDYTNDTI